MHYRENAHMIRTNFINNTVRKMAELMAPVIVG
jgi:hypothetical protein